MMQNSLRTRLYYHLRDDPVMGDTKSPVGIIDNLRTDERGVRAAISSPPFVIIRFNSQQALDGEMSNHDIYRLDFYSGYSSDLETDKNTEKYRHHLVQIIHYGKINASVQEVLAFENQTIEPGKNARTFDGFSMLVADINAAY